MQSVSDGDRELLRNALGRLLGERAPLGTVRQAERRPEGYDPAVYAALVEFGAQALHLPEEKGGAGQPFSMLALVFEELGKNAYAGPFFTCIAECATLLSLLPGDEPHRETLASIAEGTTLLAMARHEEADLGLTSKALDARATPEGRGHRITGTKGFVPYADVADTLLVPALTEAGPSLFSIPRDAEGLVITRLSTIGHDARCRVELDAVPVPEGGRIGADGAGQELLEAMDWRAAICSAAETLGGMQTALELTVEHTKTRVQYGKPIATYQALQHDMAEMRTSIDLARSYLDHVTGLVDIGEMEEARVAASHLKAHVNEAALFVSERAVQLHGAIGTTLECDVSIFYQRAKAAETRAGDTAHHQEVIAKSLGL